MANAHENGAFTGKRSLRAFDKSVQKKGHESFGSYELAMSLVNFVPIHRNVPVTEMMLR
jgi:hypothetical protein